MPEFSLLRYTPAQVQLIDKGDYYKIKYNGDHTFLNLIVYLPNISVKEDSLSSSIFVRVRDPEASQRLWALDQHFHAIIPNYRGFSHQVEGETVLSLSLNRYVAEFMRGGPTRAHLRFKCVRKNSRDFNQVLLYIA